LLRKSYAPRGNRSRFKTAAAPNRASSLRGDAQVQDLFWIGLFLALLAATLGYARLCDEA
jgi:hypothetical protein